jgi:hypothetical protein
MTRFSLAVIAPLLVGWALMPSASYAAKFTNQFSEFELPPQWQCNLEGAEWVCQSTNDSKKKDAIIVLAAKLKGEQDSLEHYLTYLKASKSWTTLQGKPAKSEAKYAKTANINGHPWIDALHMESEIPGFYTRYLATVKDDIGVLITYSITKNKYQQYVSDFESMIKTLKVFRKAGAINVNPQSGNIFDQTKVPQTISENTVFPGKIDGGSDAPKRPAQQPVPVWIIAVAVLAVGFFLWKRRQNRE